MFKDVSQGIIPVRDPTAKTKYIFNINLISTVFHRRTRIPLDNWNNTGVVLQLTVLDNLGRTIDTKLFKIYGLWVNEFGFVKGPVKLPLGTHPVEATLKFGLSDIIKYIYSEAFLNNGDYDVIRVSHVPPGYSFSIFSETVMDWDWENINLDEVIKNAEETGEIPITYYDINGMNILYFQFIMAEDIDSFSSSPWAENPGDYLATTALYGLNHGWPMFPENENLKKELKKLAQKVSFD